MALLATIALSGCAISQEGVMFKERDPTPDQVSKSLDQLEANAKGIKPDRLGVIAVGNLSAYREIAADEVDDKYKDYVDAADLAHPGEAPNLTKEEFVARIGGWTKLAYRSVMLVGNGYQFAYVPREMVGAISFSSSAETILWQGTGDLVAAISNPDFVLVIHRLLCKDGPGYAECAAAYEKGFFDLNTGEMLDGAKPKVGGPTIDPTTFKLRTGK